MALKNESAAPTCSARGCLASAAWAIEWSNPKIPFGRGKSWLACPEHLEHLDDYLRYRSFPRRVSPLAEYLARHEDQSPESGAGASQDEAGPQKTDSADSRDITGPR